MPAEYYHLAPVILTDELFAELAAPLTISGSATQRQAAYQIAEQAMVNALATPLLPATITGTFSIPHPYGRILLPHNYVRSVDSISAYALSAGGCTCDVLELDACAILRNNFGIIDTRIIAGYYTRGCGCSAYRPEYFEIAYTAGLPTGTAANDSGLHLALAMLARVELLEMIDPGALEGGAGDPGLSGYSVPGYSESRTKQSVKSTPLGVSAVANKAWRLVNHLKLWPPLVFG